MKADELYKKETGLDSCYQDEWGSNHYFTAYVEWLEKKVEDNTLGKFTMKQLDNFYSMSKKVNDDFEGLCTKLSRLNAEMIEREIKECYLNFQENSEETLGDFAKRITRCLFPDGRTEYRLDETSQVGEVPNGILLFWTERLYDDGRLSIRLNR